MRFVDLFIGDPDFSHEDPLKGLLISRNYGEKINAKKDVHLATLRHCVTKDEPMRPHSAEI
jgi:hypothetical protein